MYDLIFCLSNFIVIISLLFSSSFILFSVYILNFPFRISADIVLKSSFVTSNICLFYRIKVIVFPFTHQTFPIPCTIFDSIIWKLVKLLLVVDYSKAVSFIPFVCRICSHCLYPCIYVLPFTTICIYCFIFHCTGWLLNVGRRLYYSLCTRSKSTYQIPHCKLSLIIITISARCYIANCIYLLRVHRTILKCNLPASSATIITTS